MKSRKFAFVLCAAMLAQSMPASVVFASQSSTLVYENNFENAEDAVQIGENKAYGKAIAATKENWEVLLQPELPATYNDAMYEGSQLSFDIIIPEDATFEGELKAQGVVKMGADWKWTQSDEIPTVTCKDFKAYAPGYKAVNVKINFSKEIEKYTGLKAVLPTIAASNCDYEGEIYIDNVKLANGTAKSGDEKPAESIFATDLSDVKEAVEIGDVKALPFEFKGTGDDWEQIAQPEFNVTYDKPVYEGAVLSFDVFLPEDAKFTGQIKGQAVTKMGADWTWTQSKQIPSVTADDFESLGNGFKKAHFNIKFGSEIEAVKGLKAVIPGIAASKCDYSGKIYVGNVQLVNGKAHDTDQPLPEVTPIVWDFSTADSIKGWEKTDPWEYTGKITLKHAANVGEGALAVGLDYTENVSASWSEAKIQYVLPEPIALTGYNQFTCDVIYNPAAMTSGSLKLKIFSDNGIDADAEIKKAVDYGNGLKKATVKLNFSATDELMDKFIIGIVGSNTDYKGEVYLDNLTFSQRSKEDSPYVTATKTVAPQTAVKVSKDTLVADGKSINLAHTVQLADAKATTSTAQLYAYLKAIGESDSVLFGHQNDTHHKAGSKALSESDTKDVTGSISGVVGIDVLSLTGNELGSWDMPQAERVKLCADVTKKAAAQGAIITMSAHMPNFEVIDQRVKNNDPTSQNQNKVGILSDGSYNFSGYTPNTLTGDIVPRIMPGGDLNYLYTAYLDMIADYAHEMGDTPVLFRPLHENTGSWFWWGAAFCDKEAYKNLYRYTVEYLRDQKDVHNFIYVYSPGSEAESVEDYAQRYPGNDYVDMVGFDMYHQTPSSDDDFITQFKNEMNIVQTFAKQNGKLFAVTETGVANGQDALLLKDNERKDWYMEILNAVSKTDASYFLLWANFGLNSGYYTPFVDQVQDGKLVGHEMLDSFINFYNDGRSVFAAQQGDYTAIDVTNKGETAASGYIVTPASGQTISTGLTVKAKVTNAADNQVTIAIKDNKGNVLLEVPATLGKDGLYAADITDDQIKALGEIIGTIELNINNKACSSINAKFNLVQREQDPRVIDDFESYYGENSLLTAAWATGKGTGCSIKPVLTDEQDHNGSYGVAFNYTLVNGGYAGITKKLDKPDWSGTNALQFRTTPDGKNQKIVVQLTSNGNVFEVYLNDYEAYRDKTDPMVVTIPFSKFVGRDNKKAVLDPNSIESFGLWCNAIVPEGEDAKTYKLNSTIYYDDIKAVQSDVADVTFESVQQPSSYELLFNVNSEWTDGYRAEIVLKNTTDQKLSNWAVAFDLDGTIDTVWNAEIAEHEGNHYILKNTSYNKTLAPGEQVVIGLLGKKEGTLAAPAQITVQEAPRKQQSAQKVVIDHKVQNSWQQITADVTVKNEGEEAIDGWQLAFDYDGEIKELWNADIVSNENGHYVVAAKDYNAVIEPGQSVTIGFIGTEGEAQPEPVNFTFNQAQ